MPRLLLAFAILVCSLPSFAQSNKNFAVIAYYAGPPERLDSFAIEKLTHIIFCFTHLKGNRMDVNNARDTMTIQKMVALKSRNPNMKVILSIGGWGGCETCSPVFGTEEGRKEFAASVKELTDYFHTDGVDLDWEYPTISGFPGHAYGPGDKPAFTELVTELRSQLGKKNEISFAAGGFTSYIDSAVDWKKVMKKVDRVNLMSYDLTSGFSTISGHHTPLYSTPQQKESTDNGVRMMMAKGVPAKKIVIGAAFYGRFFATTDTLNHGLYRPTHFDHGFSYAHMNDSLSSANGFTQYWDSVAKAPYAFNPTRMLMATYDDATSMQLKTKYVADKKLNGIMFWQLADDKLTDGLLDIIDKTKHQ